MNARPLVELGAIIVGLATFAVSSVSLYSLAANCGIPEPLAAGLPIALDVGALVGALAWISEKDESARSWGKVLALSTLALSLGGNGMEHALTLGLVEVGLPLVLAVGSSIPAALFGVIHLLALMARPAASKAKPSPSPAKPRTPARPKAAPTPKAETATEVAPAPEPVNELAAAGSKRESARAYAMENPDATGGEIQKAAGCSSTEAYKARDWARDQRNSA